MSSASPVKRVSLLALPEESAGTPISGLFETLVLVNAAAQRADARSAPLFEVEIVGPKRGVFPNIFGLPLKVHRAVEEVQDTDVVIAASMLIDEHEWVPGRYPETVNWLRRMHAQGADLCSACTGALLLAETGLLDGKDSTTHWAFAPTFRRNFPNVRLRIDELLVVAGAREEFVMSGAASSWQDLVLYLIARHASPRAAQTVGKFLLYRWDDQSQSPFIVFSPPTDHGDGAIREIQKRLYEDPRRHVSVKKMAQRCDLSRACFNRRFKRATGYSPLQYLLNLRVEEAKRMLESTDDPVDEISWKVGYEESAAFRRLFKRYTQLSPGEYRRKFHFPTGIHEHFR
ncbi:GlxA family transcriptional regulator [Marinimicrobium sp. ABcell2]|uniref:GlxA family transcriptional regulator n=1 Tax=Marinimicrobium sp. ABcell2 TaxID=3069751 RepID=UPI0027B4B8E8|nr:helix-turn-helix domain-containing protein [Marinimicrobium sp. ABcell2]MDQ2078423.1 helix-turn-helix domain-containing protein [Marinimicrobium sp. ABcell2]